MYKVDSKLTAELIEKFDNNEYTFWRFQGAEWTIEGQFESSWEMCYSSEEEAREDYESMELDPEDAVLPGKSCTTTFEEVMRYYKQFNEEFVLMAFHGKDTFAEGHDGEYVATFYEPEAIFSYGDAVKYAQENLESWM